MTYLQCHDVVIHLWKLIPSSPSWPKGTEMVPFVVLLTLFIHVTYFFTEEKMNKSENDQEDHEVELLRVVHIKTNQFQH